jgi:hypothetical protein
VQVLIWSRRLVVVLLLAVTLLVLYVTYGIADALVRTTILTGFGCYIQASVWLDRRLTQGLQGRAVVYAIRLRSKEKATSYYENASLPAMHGDDQE